MIERVAGKMGRLSRRRCRKSGCEQKRSGEPCQRALLVEDGCGHRRQQRLPRLTAFGRFICIRLKLSSWRAAMSIGKCYTLRIVRSVGQHRETGLPLRMRRPLHIENPAIISLFETVALLLYFCMMGAASGDTGFGKATSRTGLSSGDEAHFPGRVQDPCIANCGEDLDPFLHSPR